MDPSLSLIVRDYHADPVRRRRARLGLDGLSARLLDDVGDDDQQRVAPKRRPWGWLGTFLPASLRWLVLPERASARRA